MGTIRIKHVMNDDKRASKRRNDIGLVTHCREEFVCARNKKCPQPAQEEEKPEPARTFFFC